MMMLPADERRSRRLFGALSRRPSLETENLSGKKLLRWGCAKVGKDQKGFPQKGYP